MGKARYLLDARKMDNRAAAYDHLFEALALPEWCGRSLDAIADALWELPPCVIEVEHAPLLFAKGPLGEYGPRLLAVLRDVSKARGDDLDVVLRA